MACTFVLIAGLVATFSRGGFIGLICMSGVMLWGVARKKRILGPALIVPAFLVVIAVAFLWVVPSGYRTRLTSTEDGSAVARTDDLKRSIFLTYRNPIWAWAWAIILF